jgi:transcriptional/translational regulatory protein YebC/TACO1
LEKHKIEIDFSEIEQIAQNEIEVQDFDKILKFKKMIEAFEEDEDVENYWSNENINESLEKEVDDFIEKNTFRT